MDGKDTLAVVMPVYNVEGAVGAVLDKWAAALDALGIDYRIRAYNDGSKDGSLAVMRTASARHARIDVRAPDGGWTLGEWRAAPLGGVEITGPLTHFDLLGYGRARFLFDNVVWGVTDAPPEKGRIVGQ